jgi:hypothetical protein
MPRALTLTDPTFTPPAARSSLERAALKLVRDERDLPFVWLALQMSLVQLPIGVGLVVAGGLGLVPPLYWLAIAPLYWGLLFGVFIDRYMLMLHNTSHRPLFKREYGFLNKWIPWVIGVFCGQSPETYYVHHITMHHAEGNLPKDLSSTMKYQRDSLTHWLAYFLRFFFFAMIELARYQLERKRYPLFRRMVLGELSFYVLCVVLGVLVSAPATLVVFVVPFVAIRVLMMAGNWGQHAFIDPDEPNNDFKSSITCINARYNRRAFNDGYHISHHLVANRHWTDHPAELTDNVQKYVDSDAIVFEGIDFFMVWVFLMLKRYDVLAKHFVELRDEPRSRDEIIALFKRRLQKFPPEKLAQWA